MEIEYKQFVIVPKKPNMSRGKVASQVAHATFMALENQRAIEYPKGQYIGQCEKAKIKAWKNNGMCVIVLECPTQIELMNIATYCEQWKIPFHLYIDEGITEIPMGTATALSTGVVTKEQYWMFEQLKLFTDIPPPKKNKSWL